MKSKRIWDLFPSTGFWAGLGLASLAIFVGILLSSCGPNSDSQPNSSSLRPTYAQIPHAVEGHADCLTCHAPSSLATLPPSHRGLNNQLCTKCHEPVPGGTPAIPHATEGKNDCLACHGPNSLAPVSAAHHGRTNQICTICHEPAPGGAPGNTS